MIRIIIHYKDGTHKQYLPNDWSQILHLYTPQKVVCIDIFAITPREQAEYQKKIIAQNLDFMRVVR